MLIGLRLILHTLPFDMIDTVETVDQYSKLSFEIIFPHDESNSIWPIAIGPCRWRLGNLAKKTDNDHATHAHYTHLFRFPVSHYYSLSQMFGGFIFLINS